MSRARFEPRFPAYKASALTTVPRPHNFILDGHNSNNFIELIDIAIQNQIHIVEMPSHTSNWLQPCDRTLFKPLKDYYRFTAQDLMGQFRGIITFCSNFAGIFAWEKATTSSNITSGFKSCGINSFNPQAIPSDAYLPNYLHIAEDISVNTTENNCSLTLMLL
nr:MFS-type transporter clz9-like [Hydra vulgaris]